MPKFSCEKISNENKNLKGKKILIAGIAYKSDVGDTRQSPCKTLYDFLIKKQCKVTCLDPYLDYWEEKKINVKNKFENIGIYDLIIFTVPHTSFKKIEFNNYNLRNTKIYDMSKCLSNSQIKYLLKNKIKLKILGNSL